ncbi:alpha/beta fold hydrolase [Streptoalloteichus hindustanus]|uniref:Pimeloyl-ACP methyl ester carboxylesterase n=1 Tax=Streptoalloteichus hindustanus TaxID=2017 RepID=A0A1M5P035_STRHI|nr:alpha/beta hydrolase [Streptoalloteichus hindustanus]SHG95131.1 Pimeloyl-ACP methyl ester carboxylesterase [Streptoalloteichus hindustanus]
MTTAWADRFDSAPRLIDVGDHTICTQIRGRGPTVVLEAAGTGQGVGGAWGHAVEAGLADMATVVTYDRVGVGRSTGTPRHTITEMADDLHQLLHALEVRLPAVVVSWSYGGLVSAVHAVRHPRDVAGLVFVDPTPTAPGPTPRALRVPLQALGVTQLRLMARGLFDTRFGTRLIDRMAGPQPTEGLREQTARFYRTPQAIRELARMLSRMDSHLSEVDAVLTAPGVRFPDVPTSVVAAGVRPARMPEAHRSHVDASHRRLADLAPRGRVVLAEQATHQIPYEQPDTILHQVSEVIGDAG